jgi:hypothetical protein
MPLKFDILEDDKWFTNADFTVKFQIRQADEVTPQNITGWALSWIVKRRAADPDAMALFPAKVTGSGITITNGAAGLCEAFVADTDTLAARAGVYAHELRRTDPGLETPLCPGMAVLRPSAHRS